MNRRTFSSPLLRAVALPCAIGCFLMAAPAAADDADKKAQATVLFDSAMQAAKQGQYSADVCAKFEASQKLAPALGTQFYWAECLEHIGRLASAWANYVEVAELAGSQSLPQQEKFAKERAEALKLRLTRMIVVVPEDVRKTDGLELKRDNVVLSPAQWGIPLPVDPGKHTIAVSARGKRQWETSVDAAGEGATITVTIPALKEEPQVGPMGSAAGASSGPAGDASPGLMSGQRIGAVVAGGVGLVGLGVGVGLVVAATSKYSASTPYCDDASRCTAQGFQLRKDAIGLADAANVAVIAGGVLLAGGVVLWLTAPTPAKDAKPSAALVPGPGSLSIVGSF